MFSSKTGLKPEKYRDFATTNYVNRISTAIQCRLQRPFKKYDQVPMLDLKTTDENMIIAGN